MSVNITTEKPVDADVKQRPKDGYDLPMYGIDDHTFYSIHVPAIICILLSFCCVVTVLVLSYRRKSFRKFFQWSKSERFVVYMAICDGGYNIFHGTDHLNILIVKDHIHPKELCEFYGFALAVFIMGQNLMVNIVAINAFLLIYFNKNISFGSADWRLLFWTFGLPFVGALVSVNLDKLGPNGAYCYFDVVNGKVANFIFTTVPLCIILVTNVIMYSLIWRKLKTVTRKLRHRSTTNMKPILKRNSKFAKKMTFFVLAFIVQWWSMALFGVWAMVEEEVPQAIHHCVTIFTNLGGGLNLIVYFLIRREIRSEELSG